MIEIKQWHCKYFFSSVFTREPDNGFDKLPPRVNNQFKQKSDFNICREKIEEKLTQLNTAKSPGPDCLHPRVLYETRAVIAYPLHLSYSKSLETSVLPADWKLAEVTAIHK